MDKWHLIENQNQLASPTEGRSLSRTYLLELNFEGQSTITSRNSGGRV